MSLGTCPTCGKLSTKLGKWMKSNYCLEHLFPAEKDNLARVLREETEFQGSILENDLTMRLKFRPGSDLRGSLLVGLNLGLADLNEADFAFSNLVCCDLRRIRLFNASLRWAIFHCCLVRQADLSNSDCRWMQANAGNNSAEPLLYELDHIQEIKQGSYKDYIDFDDLLHCHSLYGITISNEDADYLREKGLPEDLKSEIREACDYRWRVSKRIFDPCGQENTIDMAESSSDWSGTLFRSADLSHANLEGATALEVCFDSADLHETNFQCAKLSRSSFLHASFSRSRLNQKIHNSRFCNAIMNGCILDGTNISYLFFQDADLSYALIRNSHIENTVFLNCKLQNADMDSAVAIGAYFLLSDLSGINLAGIVANNSHFSSLKVSGIQNHHLEEIISSALGSPEKEKENTTLNGANLKAAELHQAEMMGVDLSGALLQGASLLEANLSGANCLAAQFAAADLKSTNFNLADLTACDLSSAGCNPETSFREAILIDTNLSGVDLSGIRFELTNLNGADLSDCRLDGAEFIGKPEHFVDLARSDLRTTSLNNTTFKYAYLDRCDLSFSRGDH